MKPLGWPKEILVKEEINCDNKGKEEEGGGRVCMLVEATASASLGGVTKAFPYCASSVGSVHGIWLAPAASGLAVHEASSPVLI